MPSLATTDLRPFIPALDFELSGKFYADLGWAVRPVGHGLLLVKVGELQHFYVQDYYVKDVAENCMLHLTVEDANDWYRHASEVLRDRKYSNARVQAPKLQDYGALVAFIHDPSGVLLHMCQWMR